jgi:hypothetical protein
MHFSINAPLRQYSFHKMSERQMYRGNRWQLA